MEKRLDLLCIGTALVDCIIKGFDPNPVSAAGFRADSCSINPGGEGVNESATAAKLGLRTGILCFLGCDGAGDMLYGAMASNGVDMAAVVREKEHPTPVTTMFVNPDGTRKSITNLAHKYNFHPEQYADVIRSAAAISVDSLFRAPFDDAEIVRKVFRTAKDGGALIYADTKLPNFRTLRFGDIREELAMVDYIFPNEDEAKFHTGESDPDKMADVMLDAGIKNVIIKLGGDGCLFKNRQERWRLGAFPVNAVDATGAGDNFIAGFISARQRGLGNRDALVFANACGAICASAVGGLAGVKSLEQVENFVREHAAPFRD
ncbi:MAG: carbohydrate kinase family protein [Oscillospiraceae bacterium]|nr:carbohydrate kinase family protein [Oscillospiraceae bacterium]